MNGRIDRNRIMATARAASDPLWSKREEAYAFERSLGLAPRDAVRRIGLDPKTGVGTKYETKRRVQERIAHLRNVGALTRELREEKRRRLDERLELAAKFNISDFLQLMENGQPAVDWAALIESPYAIAISEVRMDKDTGRVVSLKRDGANEAIAQLRDMHGFKAPAQVKLDAHVSTKADELSDDELAVIAVGSGTSTDPAPIDPAKPA